MTKIEPRVMIRPLDTIWGWAVLADGEVYDSGTAPTRDEANRQADRACDDYRSSRRVTWGDTEDLRHRCRD